MKPSAEGACQLTTCCWRGWCLVDGKPTFKPCPWKVALQIEKILDKAGTDSIIKERGTVKSISQGEVIGKQPTYPIEPQGKVLPAPANKGENILGENP